MINEKIIVVSGHSGYDSGGVGTHLRLLVKELKRKNLLLDVVLGSSLDGKLFHFCVRIFSTIFKYNDLFSTLYPLANIYFIKKKLEGVLSKFKGSHETIVVHSHDRSSTIAAFLLRKQFPLKIVQTIHAPFYQQYEIHPKISQSLTPYYIRGLDEKTVNMADFYIAVDDLQKDLILRDFGSSVKGKDIHVITNAVEHELLGFNCSEENEKYFIVARHLHEKNGIEFAVRAFKLFVDSLGPSDDVRLLILGQGPLETGLKLLVQDLDLSGKVVFRGGQKRKECLRLMAGALGSIVPSVPVGDYIEATSLSMLESLALSTPLIASNIGGIKQVLNHKDSAFLVEPADVEAIFASMKLIFVSDPTVLRKIKNGKSLIEKEYVTDRWIEKIINVYSL